MLYTNHGLRHQRSSNDQCRMHHIYHLSTYIHIDYVEIDYVDQKGTAHHVSVPTFLARPILSPRGVSIPRARVCMCAGSLFREDPYYRLLLWQGTLHLFLSQIRADFAHQQKALDIP